MYSVLSSGQQIPADPEGDHIIPTRFNEPGSFCLTSRLAGPDLQAKRAWLSGKASLVVRLDEPNPQAKRVWLPE